MSDTDAEVKQRRKGKPLVDLLRDRDEDGIGCAHECLCEPAADAIERLRAAATHANDSLSRWLAHQFSHQEQFVVLREARDKLRDALTQTK